MENQVTKLLAIISIMVSLSLQSSAHDFKMAIYEINEYQGEITLSIKFDTYDLMQSLYKEFPIHGAQWEEYVEEYLRKHFYLKLDDDFAVIKFSGLEKDNEYALVKATIQGVHQDVHKIDVFSTCLINEIEGHSNLIQANLYGKKRYFRLSNERFKTIIEY